jgi:hypothetical protein
MHAMIAAVASTVSRHRLNWLVLSYAGDLEEVFDADDRKKPVSVGDVEGFITLSDGVEDIDSPLVHVVFDSDDELLHGVETSLIQALDGSLADGLEEPSSRKA